MACLESAPAWREVGAGVCALLAFASGCSSPDATCSSGNGYGFNANATRVTSSDVTGEVILSADDTSFSTTFEAVLDQLPEVWVGEEPLYLPRLELTFELEYTGAEPAGAELPQVTAVLDTGRKDPSPWESVQESAILGGARNTGRVYVAPFIVCEWGSTEECCPYGASRCSGGSALTLSRQADVFPPVRVRYKATASADVYACLEDAPAATWTLEETEK